MSSEEKLSITRFASQQLLGYQTDEAGKMIAQVFEGVAVLQDGSHRTIYGIHFEGSSSIDWDFTGTKEQPPIDLDRFGIKINK